MKYLCLLFFIALNITATDMPSEPFVVSTGKAEMSIKPDMATINFKLQVTEEESIKAMDKFAQNSEAIKALLFRHKIPGVDITASELNKEAIRNYNKSKLSSASGYKIAAYRFTRNYTITLRELEIYPQFMTDLLKLDHVYGSKSSFDTSKRQEFEKQLMKDAMSTARDKAKTMAEIAGAQIKGVYAISDSGLNNLGSRFILSQYPYASKDLGFANEASFLRANSSSARLKNSIEIPKHLKISAKINAIFSIEN
jgi:uncharacterized protein